jgi:hypothetical protein
MTFRTVRVTKIEKEVVSKERMSPSLACQEHKVKGLELPTSPSVKGFIPLRAEFLILTHMIAKGNSAFSNGRREVDH